MEYIGYALVAAGVAAIAYGLLASRRRPDVTAAPSTQSSDEASDMDVRLRPKVSEYRHARPEQLQSRRPARAAFLMSTPSCQTRG